MESTKGKLLAWCRGAARMNAGWRASGRSALGEKELQVAALVEEQQLQQQAAGHVGEDVEQQLKEQVFRSFCPEAEQQQVAVLGEELQRLGSEKNFRSSPCLFVR